MTKEQVDAYRALSVEIEAAAEQLRLRYCELLEEAFPKDGSHFKPEGFRSSQFTQFKGFDGTDLVYEGMEFWNFGGEEAHCFMLPIDYLTDPDWESKVRVSFQSEVERLAALEREQAEKNAAAELAKLRELKEKYPNV